MVSFMLLCVAVLNSACQPTKDASAEAELSGGLTLDWPQAQIQPSQRRVVLQSGFDLELSQDAEQALHQGIPLHLAVDLRIARHHRFWAWLVEEQRQVWRISFLPLSRQYVLVDPQGERSTFSRLRHLRAALRQPHRFQLHWPEDIPVPARFQVQLRAAIDIQALPSPLRLPALFSRQWRLRSGWTTWQLGTA